MNQYLLRRQLPDTIRNAPLDVLRRLARHIDEHGEDPCSRSQAAAHEAGHCIVGVAMGETIISAKIKYQSDGRWTGSTLRKGCLPTNFRYYPHERPHDARIEMLNHLAGAAGEIVAGLFHGSSSLDEAVMAEMICSQIAHFFGKSPVQLLIESKALVAATIATNRLQFDAIRAVLEKRHQIGRGEAQHLLAGVAGGHK